MESTLFKDEVVAIRYAKSKRATIWYARALAGLIILFPFSLTKVDFRSGFSRGVSVAAYKASPAYAAFEDVNEYYRATATPFPEKMELLAAGQAVDMQSIRRTIQQRQIALRGMTVRAPARLDPQPIYIAGEKVKTTPVAASDYHDPQGSLLALPSGRRVAVNDLDQFEEFKIPTVAEMAEQLVQRESKVAAAANQKIIRTDSGAPVVIGGRMDKEEPLPDQNEERRDEPKDDAPSVPTIASLNPRPDDIRPLWLNGTVEMTGGLAFVGPETQLLIKRVHNGETFERGRIWVTEGKFEIYVKKPVGALVAELLTRDGRLLGRGEMNLLHLRNIPSRDNRVHDIRLALRPMTDGARFPVISGYSHGPQRMPVREARVEIESYGNAQTVDDDGVASEPGLDRQSTFVVRAQAKKHWSTLVVGQASEAQDIRLFSDSLVQALIGLGLERFEQRAALEQSVVWGQVHRAGQPVAGAQIEMAGDYRAIYFNDLFIPDLKLKATTGNGLFAFLKVKSGVQALRVKGFGRIYPAQVFPTEAKHVSYVEVDIRDKMVSQFKVVDMLDIHRPVAARLRMVGTDEVLGLSNDGYVEYSVAANPFMVEAEAGPEYETSRMTLAGQPHLVQIPMVKREWLGRLQQQSEISSLPGRGIVIGFVDDSDFEAEITGVGPRELSQIVYFDRNGNLLKTRHGVAGGGFAVFNAPSGLQSVYIHPTQSRDAYSQVVVTAPEYVHVIAWSAAKRKH